VLLDARTSQSSERQLLRSRVTSGVKNKLGLSNNNRGEIARRDFACKVCCASSQQQARLETIALCSGLASARHQTFSPKGSRWWLMTPSRRVCSKSTHGTDWVMWRGVIISSNLLPFTLQPRKFASNRSQPDRSQSWNKDRAFHVAELAHTQCKGRVWHSKQQQRVQLFLG